MVGLSTIPRNSFEIFFSAQVVGDGTIENPAPLVTAKAFRFGFYYLDVAATCCKEAQTGDHCECNETGDQTSLQADGSNAGQDNRRSRSGRVDSAFRVGGVVGVVGVSGQGARPQVEISAETSTLRTYSVRPVDLPIVHFSLVQPLFLNVHVSSSTRLLAATHPFTLVPTSVITFDSAPAIGSIATKVSCALFVSAISARVPSVPAVTRLEPQNQRESRRP
jgi:hypothetical protein